MLNERGYYMKCTRQITDDLYYVGGSDRRIALFENCFPVPDGVAYNSYLLTDEKTVLFDTVDYAIGRQFIDNLTSLLDNRKLDYLVVNHMEPDHCSLITQIISLYPDLKLIANKKTIGLISQFYNIDMAERTVFVGDGDSFSTGKHNLKFFTAPMVHWPEVMFTYDETDKVLFSADAFGTFGALDGRIFNDEFDYRHEFINEARRYYANIVGKYGAQVQAVFKKLPSEIAYICPLHGPVWRRDIPFILEKYQAWSTYTPEENGVFIAYASMYGDTELAANVLAAKLAERGMVNMKMVDVSNHHYSYHISDIFKYSTIVFAAPSYNMSVHPKMNELIQEMKEITVRNRAYAVIENGSWAPSAAKTIKAVVDELKDMRQIGETLTIKSAISEDQEGRLDELAELIVSEVKED
ncbi:metallo-beta-lactamase domain protein [Catonella morbi ATCC 51271]|uniref:Metallo-beta-lactamase domain protein n=2 Tax=Catonella TaxID=43996 RepID=V2Y4A4_9FIRM|nr:metallo-beta-lactamase domain protein [Catonella morbi ATCC 51271]